MSGKISHTHRDADPGQDREIESPGIEVEKKEFDMERNTLLRWVAAVAFATATMLPVTAALAQSASGTVSDDIGADGLKQRGDGSIDDSQPGVRGGEVEMHRERTRVEGEDGSETRTDSFVFVNPGTGVTTERTRTRERLADGSETRTTTDRRIAEDGTVLRERSDTRTRAGHDDIEHEDHDRHERAERAERSDRSDRAERAERPERADRPERPERPERVDRPERSERADR